MKQYGITFLLILITRISAFGQEFTVDGINYKVTSTNPATVEVAGHKSFSGIAAVPATVSYASVTYAVTAFGDDAFNNCIGLTSVEIPISVTRIGNSAFRSCTGLTSLSIPSSVTSLGDSAFCYCSSLNNVIIPDSVKSIGQSTFRACSGLKSVIIPISVTSIGSFAFSECSALTSINIPSSVMSIQSGSFYNCSALTSIDIPNSVTSIQSGSFSKCSSLSKINLPNSVISIGDNAFSYCYGLKSINLGDSLSSIGLLAFSNCSGLTTINIPGSVKSIKSMAFSWCWGLTSVVVNWAEPLQVEPSANVFLYVSVTEVLLNVPSGTQALYSEAPVWRDFKIKVTSDIFDEATQDNRLIVYPNPALQYCTIKAIDDVDGNFTYRIIDVLGRTVTEGNSFSNEPISIESLLAGNYIVNVTTEHGKQHSQKLIKY